MTEVLLERLARLADRLDMVVGDLALGQAGLLLHRLVPAASLLLGLYREDGTLDFVGHTSGIPQALQDQLQTLLPPLLEESHAGEEWGRTPGGGSRWSQGKDLPWHEVRPELVCEVRFDKMEDERFRHGTRFLRFRPDKDPEQCTWEQVRPTPKPDDPRLSDLLAGRIA